MRKILITCLLILISGSFTAQKIDKNKLSPTQIQQRKGALVKLCQLKLANSVQGQKITVDFGDTNSMTKDQLMEIKSQGYGKGFSNIVDALRHMRQYGWQIKENYALTSEQGDVQYFIMTRK